MVGERFRSMLSLKTGEDMLGAAKISNEMGTCKPLVAEGIRQVAAWGGAWAGMKGGLHLER